MTTLDLYRNMLTYADSEECPIDKREEVIAAATDMLNRHYKDWADTLPDPFAYKVVKKERVCYDENGRTLIHFSVPKRRRELKIKKRVSWIHQINIQTNRSIAKYRTLKDAANKVNGNESSISRAIHNLIDIAYGYRWKRREKSIINQ